MKIEKLEEFQQNINALRSLNLEDCAALIREKDLQTSSGIVRRAGVDRTICPKVFLPTPSIDNDKSVGLGE
jgi:hypothetical protein